MPVRNFSIKNLFRLETLIVLYFLALLFFNFVDFFLVFFLAAIRAV